MEIAILEDYINKLKDEQDSLNLVIFSLESQISVLKMKSLINDKNE